LLASDLRKVFASVFVLGVLVVVYLGSHGFLSPEKPVEGAGSLAEAGKSGEPFDPEAHEAVAVNVDDEKTVGDTVVEVLRVGYRCRGHLLRPATVRVGEESQSRR